MILDPLPLAHGCLHLLVSCMPCLGESSHNTWWIVLSPSSCSPWKNVQGSHTQSSFFSWVPFWSHASLPIPLNQVVPCFSAALSWKFFHNSFVDHWGSKRCKVSDTASPASCILVSNFWPLWGSCPNSQNPRYAVEQALPQKLPLSASPHSKIYLAKPSKILLQLRWRHLQKNQFSSAWELLHLESVPDGTTHCFFSPWCLTLPSPMHLSAPFGSFSHHCLPHWLVVQAHWVVLLSQIVICRVPSSASSPQILCSR